MKKLVQLFSLLTIGTGIVPSLTSCANKSIVIANFESYMAEGLIHNVEEEFDHQTQFLYYGTNEEIDRKFPMNYDVATPSSYQAINMLNNGWLKKLDWSKFGLHDPDHPEIAITNGHEALSLFTEPVQQIITEWSVGLKIADDENLLDYCIPYFLQTWVFAYKGNKINGLENNTSWSRTLSYISNKSDQGDERFKKPGVKLACVDDNRSVYGISHLIQDERKHPNNPDAWTLNPEAGASSDDYINTYNNLKNSFNQNSFWLNSDSGSVLNSFSDPNGNIGAFAYNGDILYAAQGADTYDVDYDVGNMQCVTPDKTLFALDMMVVNEKEQGEKLDKIYDILKYMLLDHVDSYEDIKDVDEKDNYKYGPMYNFEFIQYTDVFKTIDKYVNAPDEETLYSDESYFGAGFADKEHYGEDDTGWNQRKGETNEEFAVRIAEQKKKINLYLDIYNVPIPSQEEIANGYYQKVIERPINGIEKSNMTGAYLKTIKDGL